MIPRVDVAIAGAGPAGCALAAELARRGRSVLLLERRAAPHEKLCGGFVSSEGVAVLGRLGALEPALGRGAVRITRYAVGARARAIERELPAEGLSLGRAVLDELLRDAAREAGADVRRGVRVDAIRAGSAEGALVSGGRVVAHARHVVAATGRARAPRPSRRGFVGLAWRLDGGDALEGAVELHGFRGGYVGLVRAEDGRAHACMLVRAERLRRAGTPAAMLEVARRESRTLAARLDRLGPAGRTTAATAGFDVGGRPPRAGHALAIGDAAGVIAPACGDGISMALRSGELLAAQLDDALGAGGSSTDVARAWDRRRTAEFGGRVRAGRLLQGLLLRPQLASTALRAAQSWPWLADALATATRARA